MIMARWHSNPGTLAELKRMIEPCLSHDLSLHERSCEIVVLSSAAFLQVLLSQHPCGRLS